MKFRRISQGLTNETVHGCNPPMCSSFSVLETCWTTFRSCSHFLGSRLEISRVRKRKCSDITLAGVEAIIVYD